ncbi:cytochrome b5 [Candidatus Fermentibacteria bacterium]|nr:cytochrome b5 [Candidatus Fermentibacteria bacterium]
MSDTRVTSGQLQRHDGQEGRPTWVVMHGRVYDVSASRMWKGGTHVKRHRAGRDLTADIAAAPHGPEVFQREGIQLVGTLAHEPATPRGPSWLSRLLDRFPMLHRHPHPMIVHFPMAYPAAAALFTLLSFFGWAPYLFERMAFAMLVLGVLSTPVGIATGFFTWWLNYQAHMVHHVKCKIVCSLVLFAVQLVLIGLRLGGLASTGITHWVYAALMLLLLPNALLLGYHGGQLTFPYSRPKVMT